MTLTAKEFSRSFLDAHERIRRFMESRRLEKITCYPLVVYTGNKNAEARPCVMFIGSKKQIRVYDGITDREYNLKELSNKLGISLTPDSKTNIVWCSDTILEITKARELLAMLKYLSSV